MANLDFAAAQNWVVTADWLYQQLENAARNLANTDSPTTSLPATGSPEIIVIDCRFSLADPALGQQQYRQSHIPTAHYLDLNQDLSGPVQQHGGRHPLPDPEQIAAKLSAIGVRSGANPTLVVAYDDSRLAFAARLWWLLRYLGHDQVVVLAGGFAGWQQAGYPVTAELPQLQLDESQGEQPQGEQSQTGQFVPQVRSNWAVSIDQLKQLQTQPNLVLIDSREPERYRGEREPIDPIAGHIPGAVNYPWQQITDAEGRVYPVAQQQQHWADLPANAELVVYCGSGVTACVNLLSLEMSGRSARLYPGSWSDWCSYL